MPIAVPVAVSMAAPPGSPRRQVAAPSAGASGSLSPRAMSDVRGAFCAPPRGGGGGGGGGGRRQSNRNISPLDAATRDNAALQAQVAEMESKQRTDAKALEQAAREVESSRGVVQENAALKAQLADLQQVDSAESPFKALVRAVLTPEGVVTLQASCIGFDALTAGTRTKKWDDPKSTGVLNYLHVAKQVLAKVGGLLSAGRCNADQMWQLLCTTHEFSFLQLTSEDNSTHESAPEPAAGLYWQDNAPAMEPEQLTGRVVQYRFLLHGWQTGVIRDQRRELSCWARQHARCAAQLRH